MITPSVSRIKQPEEAIPSFAYDRDNVVVDADPNTPGIQAALEG